MLQIKNLTITHKKDNRIILDAFNCILNDGDRAVIIGEEGNGKSTLLKWIYKQELIEAYCEASGEKVCSKEALAYLPQELPLEEQQKTLYQFFSQEEMFFQQTPADLKLLAKDFHVSSEFYYDEQLMSELSGGEKIKAQIMRIALSNPTLLLLDEPSNDIDVETLDWLEQFMLDWPYKILFVSHDETLIEHTANMVIHIEQIKRKTECRYTIAHVPYLQYKEERQRQFEKQAQKAANDKREKKIREEKYRKLYQSVDHAQAAITRQNPAKARLLKKKMHAVKSMEKRFSREDEYMTAMPEEETAIYFTIGNENSKMPAGKTVIDFSLDQLFAKDKKRILAENIKLKIRGPEKICIVGKNGIGKTTLLHQIAEELLSRTDIKAEYMPQNYEALLNVSMTPVEYLDQSGKKEERTKIRTYLGSLKYTAHEMEHAIADLSGGQKAKIFLLKMSLSDANVLILDEPTRNFSPLSAPVIRRMLKDFKGAIISVSHDRKYIEEVCGKAYRLTKTGLELIY